MPTKNVTAKQVTVVYSTASGKVSYTTVKVTNGAIGAELKARGIKPANIHLIFNGNCYEEVFVNTMWPP